jgi:hypothetical protein
VHVGLVLGVTSYNTDDNLHKLGCNHGEWGIFALSGEGKSSGAIVLLDDSME